MCVTPNINIIMRAVESGLQDLYLLNTMKVLYG